MPLQLPGTAPLGMTDTVSGGRQARSTVFSLLVWLTHTTACTSASTALSSLLVAMEAASANPNSEWSVNTTCGAAGGAGSKHQEKRKRATVGDGRLRVAMRW